MLIDTRLIEFLTKPGQEKYFEWFFEILQRAVIQEEIVEVDQTKMEIIIVVAEYKGLKEFKKKAEELQEFEKE
jgi:hypothetical protein